MIRRKILGYVLFIVWLVVTVYVGGHGWAYYRLQLPERPLYPDHQLLKPGGFWGHNLGVAGALLMVVGVVMYMMRKHLRWMTWGNLRTWLTIHIFLCVMGATLVTFHTAFKVGGLVSISFWCMVGVVLSGGLGRYVYVRIPRDLTGRSITSEQLLIQSHKIMGDIAEQLGPRHEALVLLNAIVSSKHVGFWGLVTTDLKRLVHFRRVVHLLKKDSHLPSIHLHAVINLTKRQAGLQRSIHFYQTLQNVLHYWHVIHLPFTVVMFLVMIIHIGVAILFGHRWLF
jgi:hypothetical protein